MSYDFAKLAKRLNLLRPENAAYLRAQLETGHTFFVTRYCQGGSGRAGRTIQCSGETIERCLRTFDGWNEGRVKYAPRLIEVKPDSTVVVHKGGKS